MRPKAITILCVVLFVLNGMNLLSCAASFFVASVGRALWGLSTTVVAIASLVGLWKMKKWGPILYLGSFAVGTLTFFLVPPENAATMLHKPGFWAFLVAVPTIYAVVVLPHWNKMK